MPQKPSSGKVVGSIIAFIFGGINAFIFLPNLIIGLVFLLNPDNATMTVNGVELTGQEAVEAAKKMGGTMLIIALITGLIAAGLIFLGIVLIKKYNKEKLDFQAAVMQQNQYMMNNNMGQFGNNMQQPVYPGNMGQFNNNMQQPPYQGNMGQFNNMPQNNAAPNPFINQ